MTGSEIIALVTGLPAILAAITALIWALRGKSTATVAQGVANRALNAVAYHMNTEHTDTRATHQDPPTPGMS